MINAGRSDAEVVGAPQHRRVLWVQTAFGGLNGYFFCQKTEKYKESVYR